MNKKDIHVLVMPSWYPTEEQPINGIFFKEQSQNLHKLGVKVGIIYPEIRWFPEFNIHNFIKNHFQIKEYIEDGIPTIRLHGWNKFPKFPKKQGINRANEFTKLAEKYIKKHGKPDIIHAHSVLWGGYGAMLVSRKYDIPYIITEHLSSCIKIKQSDWKDFYVRQAFLNSEKVFAVSSSFAHKLQKYCENKKIEIMHNPVNLQDFCLPKERRGEHPFTFLTVGFLKKIKGIDILINAFHNAFSNNNDIKLRIGGEGIEKKNLAKLVSTLHLDSQVEFLGRLSRKQVSCEMKNSNIFVLPSRFETFGIVLIEALASGTPVVATKCGGPEDIVNNKVGRLIETNNVEELSKALKYMYENYYKFDSNEIRKYVSNNFSNMALSNKLLNTYKQILK